MKIMFETFCVGVAVAIVTQLIIAPPSPLVIFFAVWLAVSLFVTAAWSIFRGRQKDADARQALYREFALVGASIRDVDLARREKLKRDVAAVAREINGRSPHSYRPELHAPRDLYRHAATGGPGLSLSRADLKKVNEQRRAKGLPMISQRGFAEAIATAPATQTDAPNWLLYFLTFDCPAKHVSLSLSGDPGADVRIQPVGGGHGGVWSGGEAPGVVLMPEPEAAAALKAGDYDMASGTVDSVSY